jgi:hypothetical protein
MFTRRGRLTNRRLFPAVIVALSLLPLPGAMAQRIAPEFDDVSGRIAAGLSIAVDNGRLSVIDELGDAGSIVLSDADGAVTMVYPSPVRVRASAMIVDAPRAGGVDLTFTVTNDTPQPQAVPAITIGRWNMQRVEVWNFSSVAKTTRWDLRRSSTPINDDRAEPVPGRPSPPPALPSTTTTPQPPTAPRGPGMPPPIVPRLADPPAIAPLAPAQPAPLPPAAAPLPPAASPPITIHAAQWPEEWYSPVMVLRDDRVTVGVSVMYDAVAYDQSIELRLLGHRPSSPASASGLDLRLSVLGQVPPGTTRTYRVAVRLARPAEHWLETLVPYRDFFRDTYGGVAYTADPRPVAGEAFAHEHLLSPDNPRGFQHPEMRPDLHGYGPWASRLRADVRRRGFHRVMLWAVSGLYDKNRALNYPFNIITGVRGQEKMVRSLGDLASIAGPDLSVGFWWGTTWDIKRRWDDGKVEPLDLGNPDLVAIANRELDAAVTLNATMIGLDAYPVRSPGQIFNRLLAMRQRHPGVTYITEVSGPDMLHVLAPTWVNAYDVTGPDILAHFLVPGHETWAGVRYDVIEKRTGTKLDAFDRFAEARRLARAGYVVMDLYGIAVNDTLNASPAAAEIVPEHLRLPPAPAKTFPPQR